MSIYGKPNYKSQKKNFAKRIPMPKQGSFVFRVVPPIKSCATTGEWFTFNRQHFGYFLPNPNNPDKPWFAPFGCVERTNKDGMVLQECAECENIRQHKEQLEELSVQLRDLPDAKRKTQTDPLTDWLKSHNLSKKYNINVKTENGEYGFIDLGYKAYKALRARIDEVRSDKGVEPLDPNDGCWFRLTKLPGKSMNDVDWSCDVVTEVTVIDGRRMESIKSAPLADADADAILANCADLKADLVRVLSPEQIRALVESSGAPEEVAAIMGVAKSVPTSSTETATPEMAEELIQKADMAMNAIFKSVPAPVPVVTNPVTTSPAVTVVDDEEAKALAALEAIRAKKAAAAKASAVAPPKPPKLDPPPSNHCALSAEEFLGVMSHLQDSES